jgi:hypothetical protein
METGILIDDLPIKNCDFPVRKLLVYWQVAINIQDLAAWDPYKMDGAKRDKTAFCWGDLPGLVLSK